MEEIITKCQFNSQLWLLVVNGLITCTNRMPLDVKVTHVTHESVLPCTKIINLSRKVEDFIKESVKQGSVLGLRVIL